MSISRIKKEYKVKNVFLLLLVFGLLAISGLIFKTAKKDASNSDVNIITPIAKADVPSSSGYGYGACGCSSGCACGGSSCSGY